MNIIVWHAIKCGFFFRKQYDRGRIIEKKDKQSLMGKNGEAQKYTKWIGH